MKSGQLCVLCGVRVATTHDHIPPKGIYPAPRDNDINLHTVPACSECNAAASEADEEFKVLIAIDTSNARDNTKALVDSVAGTVGQNRRIANRVFSSAQRTFARLGTNILQPAIRVSFPGTAYQAVVERIVRGLYWTETKDILPQLARITVRPAAGMEPQLANQFRDAMRLVNEAAFAEDIATEREAAPESEGVVVASRFLNKDTFAYKCMLFREDQTSIWGMCFFSSHVAFAYVAPQRTDSQ